MRQYENLVFKFFVSDQKKYLSAKLFNIPFYFKLYSFYAPKKVPNYKRQKKISKKKQICCLVKWTDNYSSSDIFRYSPLPPKTLPLYL